ncbi:putative phage abortive infection protein [Zoogloea dura]|uniref:Phage abortive infection protein n=1 Tax=Zoogloea dura TaxID=2728840 RepID=A0A848G3T1_9RHOO|nr:putative phage abortive infection protein [Zoogloea dura]NML24341.1 hypothetical protein [Zoogloea dura]
MKNDDQENRSDNDGVSLWIWGASIVVVIVLWAVSAFWINVGAGDQKDDRGTFGDMFGAVNALFSGLALATLFYTVFLQRKELRETRQELAEQREQMEIQNETMRRQELEGTFFSLLRLLGSHVDALQVFSGSHVAPLATGRACFRTYASRLHNEQNQVDASCLAEVFPSLFDKFRSEFGDDISHYLLTLEQIAKFIDSKIPNDEKGGYSEILRATLSMNERVVLFYYGLSPIGQQRLKPLIERYGLLDRVTDSRFFPTGASHYYENSATCFNGSSKP